MMRNPRDHPSGPLFQKARNHGEHYCRSRKLHPVPE